MDLESAIWVVPIDDVSHMFYSVISIAPDQTEIRERARVAEAHYATVGRDAVHRQLDELVRGVLDGSKSIEEVKVRPFAVHIEDCIVQASQGVLHKRANEHLGESDGGMILLRKLWKRELEAQAQGKPLTPFQGPTRLPRGVYAIDS